MNAAHPKRVRLVAGIAAAGLFIAVMAGTAVWVVDSFLRPPGTTIVVTPQDVAAPKARAALEQPVPAPNGLPVFSGEVLDSGTGQPMAQFKVRIGHAFNPDEPAVFGDLPDQTFTKGHYRVTVPYPNVQWRLKFQADGHLPVQTQPLTTSTRLRVSMPPAPNLTGIVLDADNTPVAGAAVVLSTPEEPGQLDLGGTFVSGANIVTGPDGTFSFSPQQGPVVIAARSKRGFGGLSQPAPAADWTIRLAPWSTVQGRLSVAGKRGAGLTVEANCLFGKGDAAIATWDYRAADATGSFVLANISAGHAVIGRLYKFQSGGQPAERLTETNAVDLQAGATATVNLGGVGHPVIGRLIFPDQRVAGDFNVSDSIISLGADQHVYCMEMDNDGHFRVEDVAPGDYQLRLSAMPEHPGRFVQPIRERFTVPPAPGGYSADPIDLGTITLQPAR